MIYSAASKVPADPIRHLAFDSPYHTCIPYCRPSPPRCLHRRIVIVCPGWICLGNSVSYFLSRILALLTGHRCHLGKSIVYDTVSNLSWSVDVRTHGIVQVIEKVLSEPWPPSVEIGREVPEAVVEEDCVVCHIAFMSCRTTDDGMQ